MSGDNRVVRLPIEAVPQANLQLLLKAQETFNRDGWNGLFPFLDPQFEYHEPPEQPGATVCYGHDAVRKGWARWAEAWTEQRSELEDVIPPSDGRILVFTRERMQERDDIRFEQEAAQLVAFRNGKVLRWHTFWDRQHALEAVGLRG